MGKNPMNNLSYGLFVLTARDGLKDNGCIINTAMQVTTSPNCIMIAVNKNKNEKQKTKKRYSFFNIKQNSFHKEKHYFKKNNRSHKYFYLCGNMRKSNGTKQ